MHSGRLDDNSPHLELPQAILHCGEQGFQNEAAGYVAAQIWAWNSVHTLLLVGVVGAGIPQGSVPLPGHTHVVALLQAGIRTPGKQQCSLWKLQRLRGVSPW